MIFGPQPIKEGPAAGPLIAMAAVGIGATAAGTVAGIKGAKAKGTAQQEAANRNAEIALLNAQQTNAEAVYNAQASAIDRKEQRIAFGFRSRTLRRSGIEKQAKIAALLAQGGASPGSVSYESILQSNALDEEYEANEQRFKLSTQLSALRAEERITRFRGKRALGMGALKAQDLRLQGIAAKRAAKYEARGILFSGLGSIALQGMSLQKGLKKD